jgi:hypothetical protein
MGKGSFCRRRGVLRGEAMKMTASEENAKTLAALLGMDEEEAAEKLDIAILISFNGSDKTSRLLARMVQQLLNRTVRSSGPIVDMAKNQSAEVVIGDLKPRSSGPHVFVSVTREGMIIAGRQQGMWGVTKVHPALLQLTACYVSAAALKAAVKETEQLGGNGPITMTFADVLGQNPSVLEKSVILDEAYLAGAGAVGNAFLFALRWFDVSGRLHVVDPKLVREGNLNRCMFFDVSTIGTQKAFSLCRAAQPFFKRLDLVPHAKRIDELEARSRGPWLQRLIVAVDSRRTRRSLQTEIPGEVYDASTTDIREIVLHFNRQPTDGECLCCVYKEEENERARERHIAESLGVAIEDVQTGFITDGNAAVIHRHYPELHPSIIVGMAYDTLFKTLCGQHVLRADEGRQVVAPFAFVSVLAGTYLAIETVLRLQNIERERLFNYWRISPWSSPVLRLKRYHLARAGCEFCGNRQIEDLIRRLWG